MFTWCLYVPDTSLCVCVNLSKIDRQTCVGSVLVLHDTVIPWFCTLTNVILISLVTTCHHKRYSQSPTYRPSSCELSKVRICFPSASGVGETAARPPSAVADAPSALPSPLLALLPSVTLLSCSCHARPCVPAIVLDYCAFQGAEL